MKTYGNLATIPKTRPKTQRVSRKVIRRKGLPIKEKLLYLGTVIVFVLITSGVLSQQAELSKINYEIQQTESRINQVKAEITTLEAEEKELLDPERIKKIAAEKGLAFNPDRIQSAQTEDQDNIEDQALNNS